MVIVYKETPNKFKLSPSQQFVQSFVAVVVVGFLFFVFLDCSWHPSLHAQIFKYLFAGGCVSSKQMT